MSRSGHVLSLEVTTDGLPLVNVIVTATGAVILDERAGIVRERRVGSSRAGVGHADVLEPLLDVAHHNIPSGIGIVEALLCVGSCGLDLRSDPLLLFSLFLFLLLLASLLAVDRVVAVGKELARLDGFVDVGRRSSWIRLLRRSGF